MNEEELRLEAKKRAKNFLENEKSYQLGFLEAEQSNPLTVGLGEAAWEEPERAVRMLLSVDRALADTFEKCTRHCDYLQFVRRVEKTLRNGGRVIFSGCGATGRLALNIEASWRRALSEVGTPHAKALADQVITVFTGGDFALIKSVENFEDYDVLGMEQIRELDLCEKDLLVGITATAETTSVIGTANAAIEAGAGVEMIVCSNPAFVCERLERVRSCFAFLNVHCVYLPCGAMAVTGSTRMQSSTIEQRVCAAALQEAMRAILADDGMELAPVDYAAAFSALTDTLMSDKAVAAIAAQAVLEADTYAADGRITYFADEYLIDILADTTERTPTFMVPPFAPTGSESAKGCWTFIKNPLCGTEEAWRRGLGHEPRCISWPLEKYKALGTPVEKVPAIAYEDLMGYKIGCERDILRETHRLSRAVWIDTKKSGSEFYSAAAGYELKASFTLEEMGVECVPTPMHIFEHLAVKLVMNTVSTVCMGHLGRLTSNFMTWVSLSNKKLLDRSARLIAQECGIGYSEALEELYYTELLHGEARDEDFGSYSPCRTTILRVRGEK